MAEHLIRLRGPWELIDPGAPDAEPSRLTLPADRLPRPGGPLRLRRRFGRPARLDGDPSCSIRAEAVPGLLRVRLNGVELPRPPDDRPGAFQAEVGPLLDLRNLLELEVDPARSAGAEVGRPWGSIALVFEDDRPSPG
ncbi:hypothetical protein [Tautonia plasticadhaerens]|uniref:Uncharacterized protein n=1 Tax=Tautonia plasticadhaerens TaxID=2527974 RepID=A0A518GYC5_9BACT|nr:hypothetical protein [Tautonia plasticadhaerens]QDV33587.1 hypothetical protein ElP_14610 [Tautonia plasticadhaerens]